MLTESEREWLSQRASTMDKYGCFSVDFYRMREVFLDMYGYKDAAEFSERVAAKLAEAYGTMMDHNEKHSLCQTCRFEVVKTLGCMSTCAETVLRWAQLEVEEELNG